MKVYKTFQKERIFVLVKVECSVVHALLFFPEGLMLHFTRCIMIYFLFIQKFPLSMNNVYKCIVRDAEVAV